jgi:hypothetical protein
VCLVRKIAGPLVLILAGGATLGVAAFFYRETASELQGSIQTTARIVEVRRSVVRPITYQPVVEFRTEAGNLVRFAPNVASEMLNEFSVGDEIRIRYNPDYPTNLRVDSFLSIWVEVLIFGFFGLALFITGIAAAVSNLRSWGSDAEPGG